MAKESNKGVQNHLTPKEVDDPYEIGGKIIVMRSTRDDPLAWMHSRNVIDEAQYQGGLAFQMDFETIQAGPRAIDASEPYVDRSFRHRSISVAFSDSLARLNRADRELGQLGASLTRDVLIHGMSIQAIGIARGTGSEAELKYIGRRFRECLDTLAFVYEFSRENSSKRRV